VNLLDLAILLMLGLSVYTGYRRGAALQVITYLGLIIGLVLGALVAPKVAGLVHDPYFQATVALVALLGMAGLGDLGGWILGTRVWRIARQSRLSAADAVAGSVVAVVMVVLTTWFLSFNLVQGPFPFLSRQIRGSALVKAIDRALPRPPSLLAQVRTFLNRFGFPEVFADLPPAPAGPVRGPTRGEIAGAVDAADQSTLKVVGQACDKIQEGSGWLVEDRYLVTNAHVVAGVDRPQVQQHGGGTFRARTVLFDPDLDLAVLRLNGSPAGPIPLRGSGLRRGAKGAVLGYPGGGPLTAERAAVRRTLTALGKDIYGEDTVSREVYELQAEVRPGNSGGPFVTLRGRVAGVVFAASTTNDDVGYALTMAQAMPQIQRGVDRTERADTGPCIR
jgi:S1-C subfamily serine protease